MHKNATFATAIKNEDDSCEVKWKAKQCENVTMKNGASPKFLCNSHKKDQVVFCTECVRGNVRCHCHPNCGNKGPFYDWLLILFPRNQMCPCKLIAVVPGSDNGFIGCNLIIQQCTKKIKKDLHSSMIMNLIKIVVRCKETLFVGLALFLSHTQKVMLSVLLMTENCGLNSSQHANITTMLQRKTKH